jgi:hypothetical protein
MSAAGEDLPWYVRAVILLAILVVIFIIVVDLLEFAAVL